MVEHDLAKVGVAGSSPVFRSLILLPQQAEDFFSLAAEAFSEGGDALVVELVDTQDLKSCDPQRS